MQATNNMLSELQTIISKMPLNACCATVIPEFGVQWKEVSKAIRNARLPMHPSSLAKVLCRHAIKSLPLEELEDILGRLRLKLVATQSNVWHVIRLQEPTTEEPVTVTIRMLPHRVLSAARNTKHRGMRPEVQSIMLGDLIYLSIQFVSEVKDGSIMYLATPPGQPVALISPASSRKLLKACVEGLGYSSYSVADLYGRHIPSLLRMADLGYTGCADHLKSVPLYEPVPTALPNGIDYTNKEYDEQYVRNIIGPNPPFLNELNIKTHSNFFDRSRLNKIINLKVNLKSDNVAETLQSWVVKGAITPTSELLRFFHKIKSNRIEYTREDSD